MTQRARREPEIPEAPAALDAKGEALSRLLNEIVGDDFDVEIGAVVDEVTLTVRPADVPDICGIFKSDPRLDFDYMRSLSVVDYVETSGQFEVNYHLYSLGKRHKVVVKTRVGEETPAVPTVTGVWRGADWYERENHDLFGISFDGHPNLVPLLLYEEFEGYPGRKSFPFHDYDEW